MQRGLVWVVFVVVWVISAGCDKPRADLPRHAPGPPAGKPAAVVSPSPRAAALPVALPVALPPASSPTDSSVALRATRARIDTLTAQAEAMVRRIEATPPDRTMLLRLDAAFIDTRRLITTDKQLAELGKRLSEADQAAVQRTTKARYEALKRRVAAAGIRHRRADAQHKTTQRQAAPSAGSPKDDGAVAGH